MAALSMCLTRADKKTQMKKYYKRMIVLNLRNHHVKSANFRASFAIIKKLDHGNSFFSDLIE